MDKFMFLRGKHRGGPLRFIMFAVGGLLFAGVLAFGLGALVMVLWNWVMPDLLGVNAITYWQSWGLLLLSHILFKFAPRGGRGSRWGGHGKREEWQEHMRQWKERGKEDAAPEAGDAGDAPAGPEPDSPQRV